MKRKPTPRKPIPRSLLEGRRHFYVRDHSGAPIGVVLFQLGAFPDSVTFATSRLNTTEDQWDRIEGLQTAADRLGFRHVTPACEAASDLRWISDPAILRIAREAGFSLRRVDVGVFVHCFRKVLRSLLFPKAITS